MSLPRFFVEHRNGEFVPGEPAYFTLDPADYHHVAHVMRLREGEELEVIMRDSWQGYHVKFVGLREPNLLCEIVEPLAIAPNAHSVGLFFGLSKGDKNDRIVRQAVEIGADFIHPLLFERSVVKLDETKRAQRTERLQKIAQSAAQQAHRQVIPQVAPIAELKDADIKAELEGYDFVYVLWEETQGSLFTKQLKSDIEQAQPHAKFAVVVGPEGGITAGEVDYLVTCGAQTASLGPSILRVDTANAVTLGLLCSLLQESAS